MSAAKVSSLEQSLSSESKILTAAAGDAFEERLKRWSKIGVHTPSAIILPATEDDCQRAVEWAVASKTPFVCRSGAMSLFSTVGDNGVIIDLGNFSGIEHDASKHQATLKGGVLAKAVAVELAKDGACTTLPQGNTVGAIPFFINGGNSPLISQAGYASDQIISARLITAEGKLVTVSDNENQELLYAIRGAGQYFGLVTQLTVKTFPFSITGSTEGSLWSGRFVFPLERAEEVTTTMKSIVSNEEYATGGLIMIMAPPPQRAPALVVSARLFGDEADPQDAFKALYDLKPILADGAKVPIPNSADALAMLCAFGDYKKVVLTGLYDLEPQTFTEVAKLWRELITSCPDAIGSIFSFQWDSRSPRQAPFESAMSHHNIKYWQNNFIWHTDPSNREKVEQIHDQVITTLRKSQKPEDYVDFPNSLRGQQIDRRYKGAQRLERLKALKEKWDPNGVFFDQFLRS